MNAKKILSPEEIEHNKDRYDLRPTLDFVKRHKATYERHYQNFMFLRPNLALRLENLIFIDEENLNSEPQVSRQDIINIVARLPRSFQELSQLAKVDYTYNRQVPIPQFDEDGKWNKGVDFVNSKKFPGELHPGRMLIGYSSGNVIFPSALPEIICDDVECRFFYQVHVFLHEFFHTVEYLRRDPDQRREIVFERTVGKDRFTFQAWWAEWEDIFAANTKPEFPSLYAATYSDDLNWDVIKNDNARFTSALAEQMCESFVGYILGIVPNRRDNPCFEHDSTDLWLQMNKLATSKVVSQ